MFVKLKMPFEKINYLELSYSSLTTFKLFKHFVIGSLLCLAFITDVYNFNRRLLGGGIVNLRVRLVVRKALLPFREVCGSCLSHLPCNLEICPGEVGHAFCGSPDLMYREL